MAKQVAGRPRRPAQTTGPRTDGSRSRWRWLKNLKAAIIGAGAIAAAASAVIALWPAHDPEDSASVAVRATSGVPLSEYRQRQGSGSPQGASVVSVTPSPSTGSPKVTVTPSAATPTKTRPTTATRPSTASPSMSTSKSTTSSDAAKSGGHLVLPSGLDNDAVRNATDKVLRVVGAPEHALGAVMPAITANSVDSSGNRVSQDVAIDRVIKILRDARQVEGGGEPLGVAVSADVELSGFRNKTLTLSWAMWQVDGKSRRLHSDWLSRKLAYELRSTTDHDTSAVDLWIPLPQEAGSYSVHVDIYMGNNRVASGESQPFS